MPNPSEQVNSEMPRLRQYLKVTFLTWLPVVAIASTLGGVLEARASTTHTIGSFFAATMMTFFFIVLPSLLIVAVYVLAALPLRRRGITGPMLHMALAIGSVILVIGLILGFNLLTTEELPPWWSIRSGYQIWLIGALCLTPVLVVVHGRINQ